MDLTFSEQIAAHLAANLVTVGFVAACVYAQRNPGYKLPFTVWVGLMLPLLFVLAAYVTTGEWGALRAG